jgi:hypothetical protein
VLSQIGNVWIIIAIGRSITVAKRHLNEFWAPRMLGKQRLGVLLP